MRGNFPFLTYLTFFLVLAACGPGERFWCRTAEDYSPAEAGTRSDLPRLGTVSVEKAEIECLLPEYFDKTRAEELVSGLLEKDLLSSGRFDRVVRGGAGANYVKIRPSLESVTVITKDGFGRLAGISVKIRLYKGDAPLMEKKYSRSWSADDAPDYEKAWKEVLPPALLEIRKDLLSVMELNL